MWLELPYIWITAINIIGIPVTHLCLAWISIQLPASWFERKHPPACMKPSSVYDNFFLIRRWKNQLPVAPPWFTGFPKNSLQSTDPTYLTTFIRETRRGEFSHWMQLIVICCYIIWTPFPANIIIIAYAIISNMPCILNLRYTRQRMLHLLYKQSISL